MESALCLWALFDELMLILGLIRDEEELHSDRMKLWDEFNTCWLAVLQKQKDVTQQYLDAGQQPQNIISRGFLEKMGDDLVRLCDSMEQHGLVDYEMGVWRRYSAVCPPVLRS